MTARNLHQLPPVIWTVEIEVTDTPAPGEAYLTALEIQEAIQGSTGRFPVGLGAAVKKITEPTREF